jgi:hypothetical protein
MKASLCRRSRVPSHSRISRRIDDSDYSLPSRVDVDVPDFDRLLISPSIALEGLDQLVLKPQQLNRVVAVNVDVRLSHSPVALSKKLKPAMARSDDLDCQKRLQLRLGAHGIDRGQSGIEG